MYLRDPARHCARLVDKRGHVKRGTAEDILVVLLTLPTEQPLEEGQLPVLLASGLAEDKQTYRHTSRVVHVQVEDLSFVERESSVFAA